MAGKYWFKWALRSIFYSLGDAGIMIFIVSIKQIWVSKHLNFKATSENFWTFELWAHVTYEK